MKARGHVSRPAPRDGAVPYDGTSRKMAYPWGVRSRTSRTMGRPRKSRRPPIGGVGSGVESCSPSVRRSDRPLVRRFQLYLARQTPRRVKNLEKPAQVDDTAASFMASSDTHALDTDAAQLKPIEANSVISQRPGPDAQGLLARPCRRKCQ